METRLLANCPELIPAIACMQQMEMKLPENRNYESAMTKYLSRSINRHSLPLALVWKDDKT